MQQKQHGLRWQKFTFSVPEARSSKSRCQQGPTPSEGARERESFPAFSGIWCLQRSLACGHLTPVSASVTAWPSLCLCLLFRYEDSYHWLASLLSGKESACSAGAQGSIPRSGRFPWKRKWQPTPVFFPGKSHWWKTLAGYSPWGRKESDTTERLYFHKGILR